MPSPQGAWHGGFGRPSPSKSLWGIRGFIYPKRYTVLIYNWSNLFRVCWGEMSWLQLGEPPYCCYAWNRGGGVEQSETPCLRFWMYQRLASDWIWTHRYIFIRATGHFVHQDSWKYHPNMNLLVIRSCQRVMFRVMLEHLLNGMACSYTLWEGSRGQMWLYYLLFVKVWFEAIPCYDKNRTLKRYTCLYDNKRLYQLKSIE